DDHLAEFVHVGPVDRAFFQGLDEVAGFHAGLILAIDHDRIAAADPDRIDFGLAQEIGADGIEVRPLRDPVAVEDRLTAAGGGDDDILFLRRHFRTGHRVAVGLTQVAHLPAGAAAVFFIRTVDLYPANLAHLTYRLELGAGLLAAAEETDLAGVGAGHVFGGHAAGGAGPYLAQVVGVDQGQQRSRFAVVEADMEVCSLAAGGVGLVAHHPQAFCRRRHDVPPGLVRSPR